MKPGRIIFLILFIGAITWGYFRSMQPVVKYEHAPVPASVTVDAGVKRFEAFTHDEQLYALAANDSRFVKIQGVYRSPHDGSIEVAVFDRDLEPGEVAEPDAVRIKLRAKDWPDEIVFRDLMGNLIGRAAVGVAD